MRTIISIITDWGDGFGSGHVQRMASLCEALAEVPGIDPVIVNRKIPEFIKGAGRIRFATEPDRATGLVVRDMRDSTREQMASLKKIALVVAVDDIGEGRNLADYTLDLLPNPASGEYREDCYLYGHNFISHLRGLGLRCIIKDIDALVYAGHLSTADDEAFFVSALPDGARSVILGGGGRRLVNIAENDDASRADYAGLLLRSRVFISHFGISLYEAKLAGCSVLSVNPTQYHSTLADMVAGKIVDENAGVRGVCESGGIKRSCRRLLDAHGGHGANPGEMLLEAQRKLGNCRDLILSVAAGSAGKNPL